MQTAFRSEERFTQAQFCDWLQEYGRWAQGRYELIGGFGTIIGSLAALASKPSAAQNPFGRFARTIWEGEGNRKFHEVIRPERTQQAPGAAMQAHSHLPLPPLLCSNRASAQEPARHDDEKGNAARRGGDPYGSCRAGS